MKLIFRQYLASLKERRELDAVLPDLLSELGYSIISRPSIGTRQFGVDVAALGPSAKGQKRKLYLFSIKQGDLTRADWDGTPQALRGSINEIIDVYIPMRIPPEHQGRNVVICLCFGGEIIEAVRDNVTAFTRGATRPGLGFEEWNGDYMAELLELGVLREQLLDKALRSRFQKAVAMVDEPAIAIEHFTHLMRALCSGSVGPPRERTTVIRQLYICLWVLFVWARDAGNLEAPFRLCERVMLHTWQLVKADISRGGRAAIEVGTAYAELAELYYAIWDEYLGKKIIPFVGVKHAVSVAVNSSSSVDVSLKLFETMGRLAFRGLCHLWSESGSDRLPAQREKWTSKEVDDIAAAIRDLINNNPILLAPITDDQAIEICTVFIFLSMMKKWHPLASSFARELSVRIPVGYMTRSRYPIMSSDYRDLLEHPRERTDDYRDKQTASSTLFPLLSVWLSSLGPDDASQVFADFCSKHLSKTSMQSWMPSPDTEEKLYIGDTSSGAALLDIPVTADGEDAMQLLRNEVTRPNGFNGLSAIALGDWTILVLACRHYRLPIPPNLWVGLLDQIRQDARQEPSAAAVAAVKTRKRRARGSATTASGKVSPG